MTRQWSDERLDAALRDFVHARAGEIGAAARPIDVVSAQLAARLGVDADTQRRVWRPHRRNPRMSSALKFATVGIATLLVAVALGVYVSQPEGVFGPPAPTPSPEPRPTPVEIGIDEPRTPVMSTDREGHTATPLSDGRILIVGGIQQRPDTWGPILDSAETYDHSSGAFTLAGSMGEPRFRHTATLLADGRVLVAGGMGAGDAITASAEIYDSESDAFAPTGAMDSARRDFTATLLADGRVLVAGGWVFENGLVSEITAGGGAEIYDPVTGRFAPTGLMAVGRIGHTATLLPDGRVLIVGGRRQASAEIYDPASGTFSATGSMAGLRGDHTATLLADGRVLVVGGCSEAQHAAACVDFPGYNDLATAEIYDPASGTFTSTGPMAVERQRHSATLLADGRVLITGGVDRVAGTDRLSAEIYDPVSRAFHPATLTQVVRIGHTATLLPDGRVLLAGGRSEVHVTLASVELYQP